VAEPKARYYLHYSYKYFFFASGEDLIQWMDGQLGPLSEELQVE